MRHPFLYGSIILTACLIAGCVFDSDDKDDVKKGSISGKVAMIVTSEPVAGVKVMLFDADAKVDTTDYAKNWSVFVDSTTTGADGGYAFEGVAPGKYGVVPVNTNSSGLYAFHPANAAGNYILSLDGETGTIDFIAEKKDFPGADAEYIADEVSLDTSGLSSVTSIYSARRYWIGPIPVFLDGDTDTLNKHMAYRKYQAGYTAVLWTVDNCILFEITYIDKSAKTRKASLTIYHPLNCERKTYYYWYNPVTGSLKEMSGY